MRIVIAGSSGFLGTHLTEHLRVHGHEVVQLVRRPATSGSESEWDPSAGRIEDDVLDSADAVINLAGSSVAGNPHSDAWERELWSSRLDTTGLLARSIAQTAERGGRPPAFLAGNGISYYGDHGSEPLTESSDSRGAALLTRVTREWEAATDPARAAGSRVCILRTAPVMDRSAPPLKQLRLLFSLGLGARLGDGAQHMPMISLRDWLGATLFLLESRDLSGPFNLCCPTTPTNAEFTRALAAAVHRPAVLRAPTSVLRPALGQMAPEVLGSLNVRPAALERAGYDFADEDVREVVTTALR